MSTRAYPPAHHVHDQNVLRVILEEKCDINTAEDIVSAEQNDPELQRLLQLVEGRNCPVWMLVESRKKEIRDAICDEAWEELSM